MSDKSPTPDDLRKLFKDSYAAAWTNAKEGAAKLNEGKERAFECGWIALRAKQILPFGGFLPWLESCGPDVQRQVVNRWMLLAEAYAPRLLGSNVTHGLHLPPLTAAHRKLFLQITDGKTHRQLDLDLGIRSSIKVNKVKRGNHKLPPEEQLQVDLLMRSQSVEAGFAFCRKHGGELKDEDRARLGWAAFDALAWLLPDGGFEWVSPANKKRKPLEHLMLTQLGRRNGAPK
jgi:hypothetical protein